MRDGLLVDEEARGIFAGDTFGVSYRELDGCPPSPPALGIIFVRGSVNTGPLMRRS